MTNAQKTKFCVLVLRLLVAILRRVVRDYPLSTYEAGQMLDADNLADDIGRTLR